MVQLKLTVIGNISTNIIKEYGPVATVKPPKKIKIGGKKNEKESRTNNWKKGLY